MGRVCTLDGFVKRNLKIAATSGGGIAFRCSRDLWVAHSPANLTLNATKGWRWCWKVYSAHMRRRAIVTIGLVTGMFLGTEAHALPSETASNPYQSLIDRNVFDLKPPPSLEPVTYVPPPVKIQLVGIASLFGTKKAILKVLDPPKPGQPPQAEPFVLSEGEAQQDIEVTEINEKDGAVKVINHGTAMTLTFKEDGVKLPAGPAPAQAAPMPGLASVPARRPFGQSAPAGAASPPPVTAAVAGRSTAVATPSVSDAPAIGPMASLGSAQPIPPRPVRTSEPPPFSYEEQIIMMEVERERTKDLVKAGEYPPLPPTELTPHLEEPQQP